MDDPASTPLDALPRGPHRLRRSDVEASQRRRLERALAAATAEHGYAATTLAELTRRAGVSRATFYEHFADKEACLLAAYERFADGLFAEVAARLEADGGWERLVGSALDAYLSALDADRDAARAFILEMESAGPRARRARRETYARFAALLHAQHEALRATEPGLGPIPLRVFAAIVHGVRELVRDALDAGEPARLTELGPDIRFWLAATIHGARAASE